MSLEKVKTISIMGIIIWLMFFLVAIPFSIIALVNNSSYFLLLYPGIFLVIILRLPLKKENQIIKIIKNTISLIIIIILAFGFIKAFETLSERDLIRVFISSVFLSTILTSIIVLIAYLYARSYYRTAEYYIKK
ncbi:MAG: hypothetical protein QXW62_03040 [Candidatus Methanomethylicaceae archaeon]|nr:hypothetical protein [Candidatus Verstraetearchaeota archaeon]